MVDVKFIFNRYGNQLKVKILGKKKYSHKKWELADDEWYKKIHNSNKLLHDDFVKYLTSKSDIKTVLEIGCGTGIYPIKKSQLFKNISYTGMDISKYNIEYCKKNSSFNFICDDILKTDISQQFDLVFSHAVIDHVYDIDSFVKKIAQLSRKYAYINSYRGYFSNLKKHKMQWREEDGCYYNDVSIPRIKDVLLESGLDSSEFVIRPQHSGSGGEQEIQTVIEIEKKHSLTNAK
jgi:SAM-dependent methyltransferase